MFYPGIKKVVLTGECKEYKMNYIRGYDEFGDEISIESAECIEGLQRGFIGDLYYECADGLDFNGNVKRGTLTAKTIKDVLLVRYTASSSIDEGVYWTYTFAKN